MPVEESIIAASRSIEDRLESLAERACGGYILDGGNNTTGVISMIKLGARSTPRGPSKPDIILDNKNNNFRGASYCPNTAGDFCYP